MKAIKFILMAILVMYSINSCHAQRTKKVTDKPFNTLLSKFKVIELPMNYKKLQGKLPSMTHKEAIQFLHKQESDLSYMAEDMGEDETMEYYKVDNSPACHFKYQIDKNINILCIREGIHDDKLESSFVYLYSFLYNGDIIDKCLVGEHFTSENDWISFVLLDKTHVRVFYYNHDDTRIKEGYRSTAYYINYEIANNGKFIKKDKSDIVWLKEMPTLYNIYNPKSDDPMNKY